MCGGGIVSTVIVLHFTDIVVPSIKGLFYAYISEANGNANVEPNPKQNREHNKQNQDQNPNQDEAMRFERILCKLLFSGKTIAIRVLVRRLSDAGIFGFV